MHISVCVCVCVCVCVLVCVCVCVFLFINKKIKIFQTIKYLKKVYSCGLLNLLASFSVYVCRGSLPVGVVQDAINVEAQHCSMGLMQRWRGILGRFMVWPTPRGSQPPRPILWPALWSCGPTQGASPVYISRMQRGHKAWSQATLRCRSQQS
jgi:hypothetical protein